MSGVIGTQAYKRYFHDPQGYQQGGIVASMAFGSLFGALSSSFIADRLSRRTAIQIGSLIFILGAILQCSAQNVGHLVVGRIIAGIAIGICSAIVPVYQSEIAPREIRGRVVSLQQWAITWYFAFQSEESIMADDFRGILIGYFIQYGAAQVDGGPKKEGQG
jgi:MFS family permease